MKNKKNIKIWLILSSISALTTMLPLATISCDYGVKQNSKENKEDLKPDENKPEPKPEPKPDDKKPGTTPEVKPEGETTIDNIINKHKEIKDDELNKTKSLLNELNKEIEKREEQNLLEKRNKLIKETEAKWDDITKKIDEYSKDAKISKFQEFIQITDYLKYKKVELKDLKTTKNNTIKLLVAKYFNILEVKILAENKAFIDNIINKHKEIKDDELNKTKSLLNELNKEIERREEQNLLEKRNNLIKETEAKWDDITKKIDEYSNDAIISKFPEFIQITNYLEYKNVELKNLKATKNNTIKLLVAKYFNILEAKILEFKENIININKNKEIKDDELNKTKSLLNELNKEIERREEQNLLEKRNNLIKETEAKWDDITKKIEEYSNDAIISKFPEFIQITHYLEYKNVELKNLKATKNNTIKLLVAKYFNILEAKILEFKENIININKHKEIKDDELNKTKSLLNELNKEIEKREEQNLLEKRNNLIKETEAKWDDITKKIEEYSKDAIISKFPEFIQITNYLEYKNVELKNLKATKNNTIKLLVAKYFNILEAKILEFKENIININKYKEIKDDELNKTKSLLNELNKEIEKREIEKREEQNLLEKRNNLIKEIEAKWDDITKKIEEYSKDAIISKFSEFIQITNYLEYKNVELKNLKATKNNTIKLLVAKYFNILEAKILEFKENIININKYKEIKDDELNKTKSLLNELNKEIEKREIEKREEQNLLEKRNNLIKEIEAKWDDITKKIEEYSKDAIISKFSEFIQITNYLEYKNVELKNLKATKNNTIKLLVAKYFNILEAKILEFKENIININKYKEIKDDELNKTKSLLNELNKEIEKREIEKREEQNLLEKRNNLIKEIEAKWDDITKKIEEYSKDAIISKFPEFIQITNYLEYKNVELKNLKATKNNTIKLLVAKYFNILEAKILENKTFIENIINKNKEIKEDSFSKTKSLLNELNKEIEKREIEKREEQNLLEKRNNLIKETEAKWDDITKKIEEYSKDAIISKFPEFIQITNYLEYKNVELKNLKATKNNTIKLLVAKYFNILEAKILENKTFIENIINKNKEIKEDSFSKTKSLLNELNKEIEKRTNQALNEAKKQLNSALKHASKINTGSFDFNQKFSFNKEYVRGLEAIKGNDLNAIKEITFKLNSFINLAISEKPGTTPEVKPEPKPENPTKEDDSSNLRKNFKFELTKSNTWKITKFIGNDSKVTIPKEYKGKNITEIGAEAFKYTNIESITIPGSVKEIGQLAFSGCKNLKEVILNEGLEKIGAYAFDYTNIESITIPGSVKEIGTWAFNFSKISHISINSNNKNLEIKDNFLIDKNNKKILAYLDKKTTKVTIPSSIKEVGEGAFYGCRNLKEVILNEGLEKIGAYAFDYTNIESITIPGSVKEIGTWAFNFSIISHISINSNNKNFEIKDNFFIDKNNKKILAYLDKKTTKVTIPSSIKEIGEGAFSGCRSLEEVFLNEGLEKIGAYAFDYTNIKSITIPGSVKEIGQRAFSNCQNLKEVILNEGLEKIGAGAFNHTNIESITIPGSVKEIGESAFYACWNLKEVILNEGLEKIGAKAFVFSQISHISINSNNKNFEIKDNFFIDKNNKKILTYLDKKTTKVTIPSSVKEIGEGAFSGCQNLKELILNEGLEKIGAGAFNHTNIESITIPGSVKEIGESAFLGCQNLEKVILNEGLEKIGAEAFNHTNIESITIPGSVKEIGKDSLNIWNIRSISINSNNKNFEIKDNFFIDKNNKKILAYLDKKTTKVTIHSSIKEIGEGAFYGCKSLKEVVLNEGLEIIGNRAFLNTKIKSITIPGSVKEIGNWAFNFSKISHISINSNNKNFEIKDNFFIDKNNKKILAYLDKKTTKVTIPGSVKEIGESAFSGCKKLEEVILNEGLKKIGAWAFSNTNIESITIPGSVKEIGEGAFLGCKKLEEVILNEGLEKIGAEAFLNTKIESITIPGSVKEIGDMAFSDCTNLEEVILNEGLEIIGAEAFRRTNIESITIPGSVKRIDYRAFSDCRSLKEVVLNEGLEIINPRAFLNTNIESITIPSSVKEIGEVALYIWNIRSISINSNNKNFEIKDNFFIDKNNKKILAYLDKKTTKVTIPSSIKEIGENAFYGCTNLKEVILNEGLEIIGNRAFSNTKIKSITIPGSVKEIGKGAFFDCTNLEEVILNEGLEKIDAEAFRRTNIESITIPGSVKEIGEGAFSWCYNLKEVIYKGDASNINWKNIDIDKTKIKIISSNN
ncbi:hypothetical protein C1937_01235 [Metamycoplasma hominis]|uniref:leucine-rich repeat protein n=1 Tax=Metamycoplasma hominis TaxID=2098 RepID=UPI000CD67A14|nr:leucine-rich repeat protein [Metamycoplasma hominis]AUW37073.1 hypothetical protein C1937_01235 [Metamycoplasma hominis]